MLDELAKDIVESVKDSVSKAIKHSNEKIDMRLAEIENKLLENINSRNIDFQEIRSEIKLLHHNIESINIPEIPKPENGKDSEIDYERVKSIVDETLKDAVSRIDIPLPKNGQDGKDALEIEILPDIEQDKSYSRGTYATYNGGLWRSYERTQGMRGWECIVEGMAEVSVDYDGQRRATISIKKSSGDAESKDIYIPAMLHKGIWREGRYEPGDHVQLSGSIWSCVNVTEERPSDVSKDWTLAVKRGGTGKSAYDIARDAGFEGSKIEWLESLGKKPTVKV